MTKTPKPAHGAGDGREDGREAVPACDAGAVPADTPTAFLARIHDAARAAIAQGWAVLPLRPREKAPAAANDWGHLTITVAQVVLHFTLLRGKDGAWAVPNLGVLTGAASGGLVDVDSDTREAVALAYDLLPSTGLISGHQSNPASHLWYVIPPESRLTRLAFMGVATPSQPAAMLIELRGDGHQTMIPPSLHPNGEPVVWARDGEPARVDLPVLRAGVATVAAGAQLARAWPERGTRDEAALALCGLLARAGWDAEKIDHFVCAVAHTAGDEEWEKRGKGAHTLAQLAAGQPVTGGPKLAEVLGGGNRELGAAIVAKVRAWLGLASFESRDDIPAHFAQIPEMSRYEPVWAPPSTDPGMPVGRLLSDIPDEETVPLFGKRLYVGMLALLDGDPGLGKTLLALDIAARLTTGREMPDDSPGLGPCGVVYCTAEDDPARVLKPRLLAAGGDPSRLLCVTTIPTLSTAGERGERLVTLRDTWAIERAIAQVGARLVIFDPFMAFLDGGANANSDQEMRTLLTPLSHLAEQSEAAVLFIRHLNKTSGLRAKYRGSGSMGIMGAVRSALLVGRHPDDPKLFVLASNKNNLAPDPTSLSYRVVSTSASRPVVRWEGDVAVDAEQLANTPGDGLGPSEKAEQLVLDLLADGPQPRHVIEEQARAMRISDITLRRVKQRLNIQHHKEGFGADSHMVWALPATTDP